MNMNMNMNMIMSMNKSLWVKLAISFVLLTSLILSSIQSIDESGEKAIKESFDRALIAFTTARVLNAGISIIQGSEVSFAPAGLGGTIALGEALDPINDLIERFSWVMLASTTSIAIQKVFMEMLTTGGFVTFFNAIFLLTLAAIWIPQSPPIVKILMVKVSIVLVLLRFTVPLIFTLNGVVYASFLEDKHNKASGNIAGFNLKIEQAHGEAKDLLLSDPFKDGLDKNMEASENNAELSVKIEHAHDNAKTVIRSPLMFDQHKDEPDKKIVKGLVDYMVDGVKNIAGKVKENVVQVASFSISDQLVKLQNGLKNKFDQLNVLKEKIVQHVNDVVEQILIFIAVFILNTVIFPIVFLYGFYRLGKYLMTINLMPLFNE